MKSSTKTEKLAYSSAFMLASSPAKRATGDIVRLHDFYTGYVEGVISLPARHMRICACATTLARWPAGCSWAGGPLALSPAMVQALPPTARCPTSSLWLWVAA